MDVNSVNNALPKKKKDDANKPIRGPKLTPASIAPTVVTIVAKAVTASKLENNELITVGKFGFALAGDVKLNYYQLLLYGSKNVVLLNLILTKDFKYNVNENNTVQFMSKESWHLEFANTNDAVEFNSRLAFILWKLNGSKELYWVDLFYPSRNEKVATIGSTVEIEYIANAIQGKIFGPEVSNNINDDRYLKVNICEEGWERSMLGVNVGTQRIVYIPIAEMGAWKILTDGRQCLCLTITVKDVYEIKESNINDLSVIEEQEPTVEASPNNSIVIQSKDVDNSFVTELNSLSKKVSVETLYNEFEKLKFNSIKTNERLEKLEALVKEIRPEKIENSADVEFKKSMKTLYKSIIREFPVEQTFSGSQIHTIIRDIFYSVLTHSDKTQPNE